MNSKAMGIWEVLMFIVMALAFALITIFCFNAVNDFCRKASR